MKIKILRLRINIYHFAITSFRFGNKNTNYIRIFITERINSVAKRYVRENHLISRAKMVKKDRTYLVYKNLVVRLKTISQ